MYKTPDTKYHLALPIVPLRIGYYNEKAEPARNVWLAQGKPYAESMWNCFRFPIFLSFLCASLGTVFAYWHLSQACVSVPGRVTLILQCPGPCHYHYLPSAPWGSHPPCLGGTTAPNWCPSPARVCLRRVCPQPLPGSESCCVPSCPHHMDSLPWTAALCPPTPACLSARPDAATRIGPGGPLHPASGLLHLLFTFPDIHTALVSASLKSHFNGHHKEALLISLLK